MEDLIFKVDELITVVIVILGAVQTIIVYILPPEKAEKFNKVGKFLDFLVKTKSGLSPKIDGSTK
jgi:hypothetical protein